MKKKILNNGGDHSTWIRWKGMIIVVVDCQLIFTENAQWGIYCQVTKNNEGFWIVGGLKPFSLEK